MGLAMAQMILEARLEIAQAVLEVAEDHLRHCQAHARVGVAGQQLGRLAEAVDRVLGIGVVVHVEAELIPGVERARIDLDGAAQRIGGRAVLPGALEQLGVISLGKSAQQQLGRLLTALAQIGGRLASRSWPQSFR